MVAEVDPDAYARFTFTGVALYFHSPKWPYHVNTDVSLDGEPIRTIDLQDYTHATLEASGASLKSTIVASWVGLENTQHTLLISKTKTTPFYVLDALTYTVLDATDVAGSTSPITPLKTSFRTPRSLRRDLYSSGGVLNVPAIVGAVIAIIVIKLMICIWCVWFRRRRYTRYVAPVQMYPPAGPGSFPPPPPPYQGFPSPINPLYPTNPPVNPTFPNSPLHPSYPLTPISPYGPPKPIEPFNPYVGFNTIPTRRPGSGSTTRRDQQPNDVRPIPDRGGVRPISSGDGVTPIPAAARRESRQPARQDPRITQADGLATPIPTTNSTRRTAPGSELASVRPSSGGDLPPPPDYTEEDGRPGSGPGRGLDGNVNASSDGQPTASNSDGSAGNRVSGFSYPQPLSFMPVN